MTQRAVYRSEGEGLRTDTSPAPSINLPVDRSHDWVGSEVNVEVTDLRRLHVLNGTFDTGVNGTNVDGSGGAHPTGWLEAHAEGGYSQQTERTAYDNSSGTVMVENEGRFVSEDEYRHYQNTYACWTQTVTVNPSTNQFHLRFNYLYLHGPLGGTTYSDCVYLRVYFGTNIVWALDLIYAGVRNQWLDTGLLSINRTVSGPFTFKIGVYVASDARLRPSNPSCGVVANARYLTVLLDNVSLTAAAKPYPSQVNLQMQVSAIPPLNVNDTAPGRGSTTVVHEYWETGTITVTFSSNVSVVFDCAITLKVLKSKNSACQLAAGSDGVRFDVVNGSSISLSLWTDIAYPSIYSGFEFTVTFPSDWENVTVFDSYPVDVTSQCLIGENYLSVSGSTAQQLGWWQITFQAPNYAKSAALQCCASGPSSWRNETMFRCTNRTRAIGSIGTDSIIPNPLADIAVRWKQPNGVLWSQEVLSSEPDGAFLGASRWLGATNTTAGVWTVEILWTNGTEVAFRTLAFGLYHRAGLNAYYLQQPIEPGETIMGAVFYTDNDTGEFILEPAALVVANWSTTVVQLEPNLVRKWWEHDFNASIVGPGVHLVQVNATNQFFDEAHCYFTITVSYSTRLTSPSEPWDVTEWGAVKIIELEYTFYNRASNSWDGVDNATAQTRVYCNWTGYWDVEASETPGRYRIAVSTGELPSGTWRLKITIAKPSYREQELAITLVTQVISLEMRLAWLVPVLVAALLIVVFGLLVSRLARRHRAAQQVMLLASRQEFEDARNIVTVIILNKSTGLPIYSSYSRQGMRQELLAAFVSAITHFRQEIVVREREELFKLIPISDVVYICATRTLLSVLVTLMPPSQRLQEKLVEFSKSLDRDFDDLLRQRDGFLVEDVIASTLHEVVQKAFGLRLLAPHVADPSQRVPRRLRQVVRTAKANFPQTGIDLIQLSRYLQGQGRREKVAYNLILQAVRKGVLVALPPGPAPEQDLAPSEQD